MFSAGWGVCHLGIGGVLTLPLPQRERQRGLMGESEFSRSGEGVMTHARFHSTDPSPNPLPQAGEGFKLRARNRLHLP